MDSIHDEWRDEAMDVDGMVRSYRMQQVSSEPAGGEEMSTIGHMGSGLPLLYLKELGAKVLAH